MNDYCLFVSFLRSLLLEPYDSQQDCKEGKEGIFPIYSLCPHMYSLLHSQHFLQDGRVEGHALNLSRKNSEITNLQPGGHIELSSVSFMFAVYWELLYM